MKYNFPADEKILKDTKFNYILYFNLLKISKFKRNENHRYFYEKDMDLNVLAKNCFIGKVKLKNDLTHMIEKKILSRKETELGYEYKIKNKFDSFLLIEESSIKPLLKKDGFLLKLFILYKKSNNQRGEYAKSRNGIAYDLGYRDCSYTLKKITNSNKSLMDLNYISIKKQFLHTPMGLKIYQRITTLK